MSFLIKRAMPAPAPISVGPVSPSTIEGARPALEALGALPENVEAHKEGDKIVFRKMNLWRRMWAWCGGYTEGRVALQQWIRDAKDAAYAPPQAGEAGSAIKRRKVYHKDTFGDLSKIAWMSSSQYSAFIKKKADSCLKSIAQSKDIPKAKIDGITNAIIWDNITSFNKDNNYRKIAWAVVNEMKQNNVVFPEGLDHELVEHAALKAFAIDYFKDAVPSEEGTNQKPRNLRFAGFLCNLFTLYVKRGWNPSTYTPAQYTPGSKRRGAVVPNIIRVVHAGQTLTADLPIPPARPLGTPREHPISSPEELKEHIAAVALRRIEEINNRKRPLTPGGGSPYGRP